ELVERAMRLRLDARKRKQRRGPSRFSEARAQEREARQLLQEARELEEREGLAVGGEGEGGVDARGGLGGRGLGRGSVSLWGGSGGRGCDAGGGAGGLPGAPARGAGGAGRRSSTIAAHRALPGRAGALGLAVRAARRGASRRDGDAGGAAPDERADHAVPLGC